MPLDITTLAHGVRLRLRVAPKAARTRIVGEHGGALKVAVTAAPERGKANEAVIEMLARELGVPRRNIAIVSGETSQDKLVEIHGVDAQALRAVAG